MFENMFYGLVAVYLMLYVVAQKSVRSTTGTSLSMFNVMGVLLEPLGVLLRHVKQLPTYSKNQHWAEVLGLTPGQCSPVQVEQAGTALLDRMRGHFFAYPYPQLAAVKRHIRAAESHAWTEVEIAEDVARWQDVANKREAYRLSLSPRELATVMLREAGYSCVGEDYAGSRRRRQSYGY